MICDIYKFSDVVKRRNKNRRETECIHSRQNAYILERICYGFMSETGTYGVSLKNSEMAYTTIYPTLHPSRDLTNHLVSTGTHHLIANIDVWK